jgi:putative membrane protein
MITSMTSRTILFLAVAGVSSAAVAAEASDTPPAPTVFVEKAAQDGMTEVELGKVALAKSKNAEVREFAQRMVTDHGKANSELTAIARQKGIEPPKKLDSEHQAMVQMLEGKEGAAFDSEYSRHMNMDHTKAISLFEAAAKSNDQDLAGFAKKTLPTLKEHKKMASQLPGQ